MMTDSGEQLIGYIFQLQGHEMISICRNYSSSLYRFQRTDGSVCLDMFIRAVYLHPLLDYPEDYSDVNTLIQTLRTQYPEWY